MTTAEVTITAIDGWLDRPDGLGYWIMSPSIYSGEAWIPVCFVGFLTFKMIGFDECFSLTDERYRNRKFRRIN